MSAVWGCPTDASITGWGNEHWQFEGWGRR